jgi:hypothetical protein
MFNIFPFQSTTIIWIGSCSRTSWKNSLFLVVDVTEVGLKLPERILAIEGIWRMTEGEKWRKRLSANLYSWIFWKVKRKFVIFSIVLTVQIVYTREYVSCFFRKNSCILFFQVVWDRVLNKIIYCFLWEEMQARDDLFAGFDFLSKNERISQHFIEKK